MRRQLLALVLGALVLGLAPAAPAQETKPPSDAEAALRAANAQWQKAVTEYDLTHTLKAYADDAMLLQPGKPACAGIPALRQAWHQLMNDNYFVKTWSIAAVEISGDLAYTRGRYDMIFSIENRDVFDQPGKYVVIWKKVGNEWKIATEIYNADGPPTPHKK